MNGGLEVFAISFLAVLVQNLLFKRLSDQAALRELRKQIDRLQQEMEKAKAEKNLELMEKQMSRFNDLSMRRLSLTMRPNLLSSLAFIAIFGFLSARYSSLVIQLPVPIPVPVWQFPPIRITQTLGWLGWYLLCAIFFSVLIRGLLEIEM